MRVTRIYEWDAGHRVTSHGGKCKHAHGHRYKVEATYELPTTPTSGMVLDFGIMKEVMASFIDGELDHGYMAHPADEVGALLQNLGNKVYVMPEHIGQPTAENIAQLIGEHLVDAFEEYPGEMVSVVVWETPNCFATWEPGACT